jgi:aminopeptidase
MTLSAGDRLGRYETLEHLGAGGMGEVYRATDTEIERNVAVKKLPEAVAQDEARLARFEREAKAVAKVSHPNVLDIHDCGREGEITYSVSELLEGETLRDHAGGGIMRYSAFVLAILCATVTSVSGATPAERHADVLLRHSVDLQPGEHLVIDCSPAGEELSEAVFRQALEMGARVTVLSSLRHQNEMELRSASDEALRWLSPVVTTAIETANALIVIDAPENTRAGAGNDPTRLAAAQERSGKYWQLVLSRSGSGELRWVYTHAPTPARAQQAGMGFLQYREFAHRSMGLDEEDPVAAWSQRCEEQAGHVARFNGGKMVRLTGPDIDLTLSIDGRHFVNACGRGNFPDGEIFTSPVEDTVNGWVRFSYPLIYQGQTIEGLQLWIERGRVARFEAASGQQYLETLLALDDGARVIGELGIGTNGGIDRFTKNMLYDEKMDGTVHFALGSGYPEAGGTNVSQIHIDMLADMSQGAIEVDGRRVYENGRFVD